MKGTDGDGRTLEEPARRRRRRPGRRRHGARYAAPIGLVVVFVIFFIATPNFLTVGQHQRPAGVGLDPGGAGDGAAARRHGGRHRPVGRRQPALGGCGPGFRCTHGWPLVVACVLAVVVGGGVGLANGLLIARLNMTDFIVTLGSLSVVSGLTLLLTGGNTVPVNSAFLRGLALDGVGPVRWFWLVAIVAALLVAFLLFRTRRAPTSSRPAATSMPPGAPVSTCPGCGCWPTSALGWPAGWPACCWWPAPAARTPACRPTCCCARSPRSCSAGPACSAAGRRCSARRSARCC